MADLITTASTIDATRSEFISEIILRELQAAPKLLPLVRNVSQFAIEGRKSIEFPHVGEFTVAERSDGATVDAQRLTYGTEKLDLDKSPSVQWLLEKKADVQSILRLEAINAQKAARAHARYIDSSIIETLVGGAPTANDVTYNAADIEGNILDIVEKMDEANCPEENRFVLFRPAQKKLLLKVANFVQADRRGTAQSLLSGELGEAYGLRFIMSNNQTTSFVDDVMVGFHSDAMAVGFQLNPFIDEQKAIEYGAGARRYAMDLLWGLDVQLENLIVKVA